MQVKNSSGKSEKKGKLVEDHLVVKRKGGGSIIDHRPLFSSNGEILYVVWKQLIRKYSTQTGDYIGELEPAPTRLIAISFYTDNFNTIVGCTEAGDLINWNSQNGVITRKLSLQITPKTKISTFHIITTKTPNNHPKSQALITSLNPPKTLINLDLYSLETGKLIQKKILEDDENPSNLENYSLDIIGNFGDNLIALAHSSNLYIIQPTRNLEHKHHKIGLNTRKITCLTGHPEDESLALGDSSGRVLVYKNLFSSKPTIGTYHWHTLPVTEIAFSKSGGHMYTGGSECVLVKWTLSNLHQKSYLPRLPAPIKHLTISPENIYVAVSTLDNGIVVVNPQKKLTSVVQNFTWGIVTSSNKNLFPAGLTLDPRTGSLVLNSRTGHVQFFDTNRKSLLYNINITSQNYLTQERKAVVINTEVTKVSFNHDGGWMATVEERDDKISCPEVRLKFWIFDNEKQNFVLNTCVELPHDNGINALHFGPNVSLDGDKMAAITTGQDGRFKIWRLEEKNFGKKGKYWICGGGEGYRGLVPTDAGFSIDGSVVGVGFGGSLTIWGSEEMNLKCSLTSKRYPQRIRRIEFGRNEGCHLVVVGSDEHIGVWNLLTLSLNWSVNVKMGVLVADSCSNFMAVFSRDNQLFVFNPLVSSPVYVREGLLEGVGDVLGACFVPNCEGRGGKGFCEWQRRAKLFFIDENQELLALEDEREGGVFVESLGVGAGWTGSNFGRIVAEERTSNVEARGFIHGEIGSGKGVVEELLTLPAHTLPPMRLLCAPFILSLRSKNENKRKNREEKNLSESQNSDDSDEEYGIKHDNNENIEMTCTDVKSGNDDNDVKLVSLDWSFLGRILPN